MRRLRRFVPLFALALRGLCALAPGALPAREPATARELLEAVDDLYRSESSIGTSRMQVVTERYERTLRLRFWTSAGGPGSIASSRGGATSARGRRAR